MAEILVQCPNTGTPISTGLKTEWVLLRSLPGIAIPLRCPVCGQVHKWHPQDAWVGTSMRPPVDDFLAAPRATSFVASACDDEKTPRRD